MPILFCRFYRLFLWCLALLDHTASFSNGWCVSEYLKDGWRQQRLGLLCVNHSWLTAEESSVALHNLFSSPSCSLEVFLNVIDWSWLYVFGSCTECGKYTMLLNMLLRFWILASVQQICVMGRSYFYWNTQFYVRVFHVEVLKHFAMLLNSTFIV